MPSTLRLNLLPNAGNQSVMYNSVPDLVTMERLTNETTREASDENNAQPLTEISFLKKKAANPVSKGIHMNRTAIMSEFKS